MEKSEGRDFEILERKMFGMINPQYLVLLDTTPLCVMDIYCLAMADCFHEDLRGGAVEILRKCSNLICEGVYRSDPLYLAALQEGLAKVGVQQIEEFLESIKETEK